MQKIFPVTFSQRMTERLLVAHTCGVAATEFLTKVCQISLECSCPYSQGPVHWPSPGPISSTNPAFAVEKAHQRAVVHLAPFPMPTGSRAGFVATPRAFEAVESQVQATSLLPIHEVFVGVD